MRRTLSAAIAGLLLLLSNLPAFAASPGQIDYDRGVQAYHVGHNTTAVADFSQAIAHGYGRPGTYYLLGLAYSRLKQWNNAVWALNTVTTLDPTFVGKHPTLTSKLAQAQKKGGVDQGPPPGLASASPSNPGSSGTTATNPSGPGAPQAATIAGVLSSAAVYVDPAMASAVGSGGDTLKKVADDLQSHSSTAVRFAILSAVPSPYTSAGTYAYALFDRLGLKKAVVIVVTRNGVAARTDRLSESQTQPLVSSSLPQFLQGSYVAGADSLARAIVQKADDKDSSATRTRAITIAVILLIVLGLIALFVGLRAARWSSAYRQATEWRDSLTQLVTDTESHVNYLPPEHPAKQSFLTGSAYYSTAARILEGLEKVTALQAALRVGGPLKALGQARANLQGAERSLQEAEAQASGKSTAGGPQAAPGGELLPQAQFLDRAGKTATPAACFFCAKPLDPATAAVVPVPFGGSTRRVMACDEHAADVRAGRQPQVRSVPDPARGNQPAPWWGVPSYSPARDYVYDPYYYRGGGGIGWGDLLLYEALFDRPRSDVVFVNDYDGGGYDQGGPVGYGGDRPDSASFDAGGRDMPSAAEAGFGTAGADYSGGDRS